MLYFSLPAMRKAKKSKEDLALEKFFGSHTRRASVNLEKIADALTEVPPSPVPKKQLISKVIIAMKPDQRCMNVLAKNWNKVRELTLVKYREPNCYRGYSAEDVLIETFEYLIRDEKVKEATEEEIIDSFVFRFNNLMWVARMDGILERLIMSKSEIDPATFQVNKEEAEEEEEDDEVTE